MREEVEGERPAGHVRALVVPVDGPAVLGWVEPSLDALRAVIGGGWLEGVQASALPGDWHAYVDEEGKLKGLPYNPRATRIAILGGWPSVDVLMGPAVFLGNGEDGEETDVPEDIIGISKRI